MEWIRYLAKAAGAAIVALVGVSLLTAAIFAKESRAMIGGLGFAACAGAWFSWPRTPNAWRRDPPTERQLRYAADLGIIVRPGASKGEVSDMISSVTGR